jgi:hypothetical protein
MVNAEVRKQFRITSAFSLQHSALACASFLVLALAWTWPVVTRLSSRVPHDPGDPILNTWILWWNTQALPFTDAWWNAPIFVPMPGAFALSEHLAGIAVFTTPLQLLGLTPLAAYNLAFIASFWLCGVFAYHLAYRLSGSRTAGFIGGFAFAFAPYRAGQLAHLQVLTSQWMPLALLAMHAWIEERRLRWLVVFAAAWLVQALSNGYYLMFLPVLMGMWLLWFIDWRQNWRRGGALVATFAGSSLLLLPVLLRYQQIQRTLGLHRTVEEMQVFSATLTSFHERAALLRFWPQFEAGTREVSLFPGVTVIALVICGALVLAARRQIVKAIRGRSPALFYAAAAVVLWWLCLGPARHDTVAAWAARPYSLLTMLPGFEGLRVPARFAMLAVLCVSIAAAIASARLLPQHPLIKWCVAVAICAGLFADGWSDSIPLYAPPGRAFAEAPERSLVIELPVGEPYVAIAAMYRAMLHHRPLVNGYSGHVPTHYSVLESSLSRNDPSMLHHFARGRPLVVIVNRNHDREGRWSRLVRDAGGIRQEDTGVGPLFVIPPQPSAQSPALGKRLQATTTGTDDETRVDLGGEQFVRAITIALRGSFAEIEPTLTIETSIDGNQWTTAWQGWTGEPAVMAALKDAHNLPMTLFLPDVRARYLRIRPTPAWVADELEVFAPN